VKLSLHFILPSLLLGALFLYPVSRASNSSGPAITNSHLTCEDGEQFILQEKGSVETLNSPLPEDDYIEVDTRRMRLTLYREGKAFKTYPVAIGARETPSPIGEWKVIHKGGNWGGGFGSRWIGLNVPWGIYGIHGTNKPGSIGYHASHGCIRMYNQNVLELYQLVKVGTWVNIIGDLPQVKYRKELSRGNTGKDVVAAQFALRRIGFDPGRADGRFGEMMEKTVRRVQFFYGLAPTGKLSLTEQYLINLR
jgi:hypothetical protein